MFFCDQEGTQSSFQGVRDVIEARGLFCSLYSDRGSHYWYTPEAGGKVDKSHPTQFGRALQQLGIEMIPAYSPEARGRSERAFRTHQERLVRELALAEITTIRTCSGRPGRFNTNATGQKRHCCISWWSVTGLSSSRCYPRRVGNFRATLFASSMTT